MDPVPKIRIPTCFFFFFFFFRKLELEEFDVVESTISIGCQLA